MDSPAIEERYGGAARAAMGAFGLAGGALSLVTVSENVTFRVDALDGNAYVLCLHRTGYHTLAELDSERAGPRRSQARGWQCRGA